MSFKTKDPKATPWWAKRRVLGSALAVTALVASGAAANASSFGDGFLVNRGGPSSQSSTHTSTSSSSSSTLHANRTSYWSWNGSTYAWNGNLWGWNGTGVNRFGFRVIVTPHDRTFTKALGINDRNMIVGAFGQGTTHSPSKAFWGSTNSAFWTNSRSGQMAYHGLTGAQAVHIQAVAINNAGDVAGFFVDRAKRTHGFILWRGHFRVVDFPGTSSRPGFNQLLGLNNFGTAAGVFKDRKGLEHGYLFDARTGRFIVLKLPVRTTSFVATGVNDRGQVSGFFAVGHTTRGFLWSPRSWKSSTHSYRDMHGSFVVLNLGHRTDTRALGINNAGTVVGSFVDGFGKTRGFVRVNAKLIRIVNVPGSTSTVVHGINNRGLIVGFFSDRGHRTLGFVAHR